MKTKKILLSVALLSFSATLVFTSCKKKEGKVEEPVAEAPDGQSGVDSREAQGENDAATNEINDVLSNSKRTAGKSSGTEGTTGICGFDVDSVKIAQDTILFKYNGVTCNNRTRTGVIRLSWQANTKWKNAGAVIKVEYLNYKVVRASDQKSMTFNGTQLLTNVSGGTWVELVLFNQALVNTITGTNLNVTFEDNKTAIYNINRKITYTYPGTFPTGILTAKAEGIGSNNGLNSLENYGKARNGDAFTSQVTTPVVWNTTCGGAVLQGAVDIKVASKSLQLKFIYGVNAAGNIVTVGPNQCPYGWKMEWDFAGSTGSKVFNYN